jgi:hypothetical protein
MKKLYTSKILEYNAEQIELLSKYGIKIIINKHQKSFYARFHDKQKDFNSKLALFSQLNIEYSVYEMLEESDYQKYDWFVFSSGSGMGYPCNGEKYRYTQSFDANKYCNKCGMEIDQISPIRFNKKKSYKSEILGMQWYHGAVFVFDRVKKLFEENGISGLKYLPVINGIKGDRIIKNIHQIIPIYTLPRCLHTEELNIEKCEPKKNSAHKNTNPENYCGRIKFNYPKKDKFIFHKDKFECNYDIALMSEYIGSGGSACQYMVISKKLRNLIKKNKLKVVNFKPIEFI